MSIPFLLAVGGVVPKLNFGGCSREFAQFEAEAILANCCNQDGAFVRNYPPLFPCNRKQRLVGPEVGLESDRLIAMQRGDVGCRFFRQPSLRS